MLVAFNWPQQHRCSLVFTFSFTSTNPKRVLVVFLCNLIIRSCSSSPILFRSARLSAGFPSSSSSWHDAAMDFEFFFRLLSIVNRELQPLFLCQLTFEKPQNCLSHDQSSSRCRFFFSFRQNRRRRRRLVKPAKSRAETSSENSLRDWLCAKLTSFSDNYDNICSAIKAHKVEIRLLQLGWMLNERVSCKLRICTETELMIIFLLVVLISFFSLSLEYMFYFFCQRRELGPESRRLIYRSREFWIEFSGWENGMEYKNKHHFRFMS